MWASLKDEMAFLQKFPDLLQATTDDEEPTPSYLYNQLSFITNESNGMYCSYIVGFLISRIQYGSLQVQFKSLKVCQHLVRNGHPDFRTELQRKDAVLKEAGGLMDPFLSPHGGNITSSMVRGLKQEVLSELFDDELNVESFGTPSKQPSMVLPPGYGSGSTYGKLPGFGSMTSSGNSGDSVVENLSQMVNRMLTPSPPSLKMDRKADIAHHLPRYQPASLDAKTTSLSGESSSREAEQIQSQCTTSCTSLPARKLCRSHKPGRAGGGWDEAEFKAGSFMHLSERDILSCSFSNRSDISTDSLDREESADPTDLEESKFVDDFTCSVQTFPPSWTEIVEACKRCSALNCDKIVELLGHKLIADKDVSILRTLVLLEAMLHRDLVILEVFTRCIFPNLELLQSACKEEIIRCKAKKLYLSVQKLSDIQKQVC